jgi:hypothetical protein
MEARAAACMCMKDCGRPEHVEERTSYDLNKINIPWYIMCGRPLYHPCLLMCERSPLLMYGQQRVPSQGASCAMLASRHYAGHGSILCILYYPPTNNTPLAKRLLTTCGPASPSGFVQVTFIIKRQFSSKTGPTSVPVPMCMSVTPFENGKKIPAQRTLDAQHCSGLKQVCTSEHMNSDQL